MGGLLGGVLGVEAAKVRVGIRESTGDLFAFPVLAGLAVGRVGCLFAGLGDETFGSPTRLPWGFDFGDGVPRHPAPLYEIAFLLVLALLVRALEPPLSQAGDTFRVFMAAYLAFRVTADFLKPPFAPVASAAEAALPRPHLYGFLTAIQIAAFSGLLYYAAVFLRRGKRAP